MVGWQLVGRQKTAAAVAAVLGARVEKPDANTNTRDLSLHCYLHTF